MKKIFIVLSCILSVNLYGQKEIPKNMLFLPGGQFNMGKNSPGPSDWQPEHMVTIDSFFMDQYEVTNQQYHEFCKATNHPLPIFWGMKEFRCGMDFPDYPVVGVSFFEAEKYAKWVNKRLPTEAEWEYAARGGIADLNYPQGNKMDSTIANFGSKYKGSLKVGTFMPNNFGLSDMAGNVWEWTTDNYQAEYYKLSPLDNPKGPDRGRFKVVRGGSWHSGAMCLQNYYRNGLSPSWIDFAVGFRCVRSAGE